jgi:hypothetical protein
LQKLRSFQKTFFPGKTARHPGHLFSSDGNRQSFATLGTTSFYDKTAIFSRHTDKKTMGSFPGSIAGLKGPFHVNKLLICLINIVRGNGLLTIKRRKSQGNNLTGPLDYTVEMQTERDISAGVIYRFR